MSLLKNIREIRTQKRFSQEFIADKLGVTTSNYSRRENGIAELSVRELAIIAQVFDMEPIDIYTWPEKYTSSNISSVAESKPIYHKTVEVCDNCRVLRGYIKLLEEKIDIYERRK